MLRKVVVGVIFISFHIKSPLCSKTKSPSSRFPFCNRCNSKSHLVGVIPTVINIPEESVETVMVVYWISWH